MAGMSKDETQSLYERIDELHRLVAHRLATEGGQVGEWLHDQAVVPAWRRPTEGELRWPVAVTLCTAGALQTFVPDKLQLIRPSWARCSRMTSSVRSGEGSIEKMIS